MHILRDAIGADNLYHYEEIVADHQSFLVGKDMSYFTVSVMDILRKTHKAPVPGIAPTHIPRSPEKLENYLHNF